MTALLVIKYGSEYAWRIEVRKAEPIDRTVDPDQGYGMHIADDSVVLDGLIAQGVGLCGRLSSLQQKESIIRILKE